MRCKHDWTADYYAVYCRKCGKVPNTPPPGVAVLAFDPDRDPPPLPRHPEGGQ